MQIDSIVYMDHVRSSDGRVSTRATIAVQEREALPSDSVHSFLGVVAFEDDPAGNMFVFWIS